MDVGVKQKDQVRHGHETGSDGVCDLTNYISGDDGIYMAPEMTISALAGNIYEPGFLPSGVTLFRYKM